MTCAACKGTGKVEVTSFVDSSKIIKNSCHVCKGRGYIALHCPFCGEDDFDAIGLKAHLLRGHCEAFESVARL